MPDPISFSHTCSTIALSKADRVMIQRTIPNIMYAGLWHHTPSCIIIPLFQKSVCFYVKDVVVRGNVADIAQQRSNRYNRLAMHSDGFAVLVMPVSVVFIKPSSPHGCLALRQWHSGAWPCAHSPTSSSVRLKQDHPEGVRVLRLADNCAEAA